MARNSEKNMRSTCVLSPKMRNKRIVNFCPHFRNIAEYRINGGIADGKKRNNNCGGSKFKFGRLSNFPFVPLDNIIFLNQNKLIT
jgi:hypothetical protein